MSQIINWEYYGSHFPNIIPEDKFDSVEVQAEVEFNKVVHPYMLADISEDSKKDCIFQLCNFIYSNQPTLSGKAVTSVNNNGYSESYAITSKEQANSAMRDIIYSCVGRLAGAF